MGHTATLLILKLLQVFARVRDGQVFEELDATTHHGLANSLAAGSNLWQHIPRPLCLFFSDTQVLVLLLSVYDRIRLVWLLQVHWQYLDMLCVYY